MSRPRRKVREEDPPQASATGGAGGRLMQAAGGIFRLRGELLAAGILASLRRWNAHGYRLGRELVKAGLPMLDSATLYRTLRELERAGLVSSFWDTSAAGPARRMYSLTKAGDVFLSNWIETLQRFQAVFQRASDDSDLPRPEPQEANTRTGRSASRSTGTARRRGAAAKGARRSTRATRRSSGAQRAAG